MSSPLALKIKIQLFCGDEISMGPGKADLLDAIREHGSISAAARAMGMSYRRAWQLVDVMNRCWNEPLVGTAPGGAQGRGAWITDAGDEVLAHYRTLQQRMGVAAFGTDHDALAALARPAPRPSQKD